MTFLHIVIGIAIGTGGYWVYDNYISKAKYLGEQLLAKAEGDFSKALDHIKKLV